jgi:carboxyl-terminal processing protease
MKRYIAMCSALLLSATFSWADLTPKQCEKITQVVGKLISDAHYRQAGLTDEIAGHHLETYLNLLDFSHMIFLQSDVDAITKKYGTRLDDLVKLGKIHPSTEIYDLYLKRLTERQQWVEETLKSKIDFTKKERFLTQRTKEPWPPTQTEARQLWHLRIKLELLNDRLALDKDDAGELDPKKLKESRAKISRRYQRLLKTMKANSKDDVLEIYLSALTRAFDPHSDYMSPIESKNFDITSIKMQLTGVGAVLRADDGYTTIVRIMPGGPAAKSKLLHANDKVIAVKNPGDKEATDIIDMKLDDVVQLIRGKKDSIVELTIIPADKTERKVIKIKRDVVKLEDSLARAYIIERKISGKTEKLGILNLPGFYKDCADHCRTLVKRLKNEKVDGIVLDLRMNGGGLLNESIEITGLFIDEGPVVQVKDYMKRRRIHNDNRSGVLYDGPLVVAVSPMSASASEIVAAALQDHGRALIVGTQSTHGKGTVQTLQPLSIRTLAMLRVPDSVQTLAPLTKDPNVPSRVKFTIQKFYRINGSTTQRLGVLSDVELPSIFDHLNMGEAKLPRALEADKIAKANYKPLGRVEPFLTSLRRSSAKRIQNSTDFKYINEDIARAKKQQADKTVSLNETERHKERAEYKTRIEARNKERAGRKQPVEKYFEIDVKGAEANKPLKKLEAPKPKVEKTETSPISEDDSNTFTLDASLRETLDILSDYVRLRNVLPNVSRRE